MTDTGSGLPRFENLDAVQHWALESILREGYATAPRGHGTLEILATGFTLARPRARTIANAARRWSAALAVGEFAWHVSGSDEVAPIAHYAPRWRDFSDDGARIRGSCYGRRIFGADAESLSQWSLALALLRHDPQTRRAVLDVKGELGKQLDVASKDVPCVTSCQFLIRDGRLDAIVHMRSNDVIWGMPYDVFLFTMLQEMAATELGVELGHYHHFAGSLHLYDRHMDLAARILAEGPGDPGEMDVMSSIGGLQPFLSVERQIREYGRSEERLDGYWSKFAEPLLNHAQAEERRRMPLETKA